MINSIRKETSGVYSLPAVTVNGFLVHGNIDCEPPITKDTCGVLDAICAGYLNGTEPSICDVVVQVCIDSVKDCNHTCYGHALMDRCGHCLKSDDDNWNSCVGCDGVPGSNQRLNPCRFCIEESEPDFNTRGQDCNHECGGTKTVDRCGVCLGTSGTTRDACVDCFGYIGGNGTQRHCAGGVTLCLHSNDPNIDNACDAYASNSSNNSNTLVTAISVISIIVVLIAVVAIYYLWRRQRSNNTRFNTLLKQYTLMDDRPSRKRGKPTKVPQNEDDEDDEEYDYNDENNETNIQTNTDNTNTPA